MNGHLNDEKFAALLAGERSPQIRAHLDTCEPCRVEAEQLCGALSDFRQQSLSWAETRPVPVLVTRQPILLPLRRPLIAAAAAVLVFAAIHGAFHPVDPRQTMHEHAAGTLADDNRLLLSIDDEINVQDTSPRVLYASKSSTPAAAERE